MRSSAQNGSWIVLIGIHGILLPGLCFFLGPASQGGLMVGLIRFAGLTCSGTCLLGSLMMLTLVRKELQNRAAAWWGLVLGLIGLAVNAIVAMMFSL
jgi:hypothetical protein